MDKYLVVVSTVMNTLFPKGTKDFYTKYDTISFSSTALLYHSIQKMKMVLAYVFFF
jgi:hypothetical protein